MNEGNLITVLSIIYTFQRTETVGHSYKKIYQIKSLKKSYTDDSHNNEHFTRIPINV